MRAHHVAAAGDIANQQDHQDAVENHRSRCGLRAEIKKAVDEINGIATNKHSPAASVGSVTIDDGDKTQRKHSRQRPETRRGQKQRDNPDRDVSDNLIEQSDRTFPEFVRGGFGHLIPSPSSAYPRAHGCRNVPPSLPANECNREMPRTAGRSPGASRNRR